MLRRLQNDVRILMMTPPTPLPETLVSCILETPLGPMMAMSTDTALVHLDFVDKGEKTLLGEKPTSLTGSPLIREAHPVLLQLKHELESYFAHKTTMFKTPIQLQGSSFQQKVWQALCQIPYKKTISYGQLAIKIDAPKACRAVGNANGANKLAIIVPCHRVIQASGALGGYAGGIERKRWLLEHEAKRAPIAKEF